ncbi:hypothetical protein [Tautonia rosea]|uniref:hypothetical protein n=1 Tax=Tautonia rosea TaxID=2728037 RepID=UPI001475E814|nr:hypothetical protein [Tautonia rosea]
MATRLVSGEGVPSLIREILMRISQYINTDHVSVRPGDQRGMITMPKTEYPAQNHRIKLRTLSQKATP